ncbi:hypothetical protein DUI87_17145 [Hirundo rustica rustica]|uniref:Immunoglobulin subtype domain-containing protein n=1 Tax=Hirundo rustica rustica TaxID=333673 RepID=A0A3M0K3N9_HIRRU|nr:hypothetical protein DUI87_17145 [Hirundo rustica rustica]
MTSVMWRYHIPGRDGLSGKDTPISSIMLDKAALSLAVLNGRNAHIYCKDVVGIVGENFTFPVQIDKKKVETVWRKGKDKVAEWEGENKPTYFGLLSNRSVLTENGSFTIVHLEKNDAGTYELQYRHSGKDHYLNFVLVVLGGSSYKRNRNILIGFITVSIIIAVGIVAFLYKKDKNKSGAERRAAQNNSLVNRSERAFNEDDSAPKDKQIVENGVNQEVTSLLENVQDLLNVKDPTSLVFQLVTFLCIVYSFSRISHTLLDITKQQIETEEQRDKSVTQAAANPIATQVAAKPDGEAKTLAVAAVKKEKSTRAKPIDQWTIIQVKDPQCLLTPT